jgi:hypothetical protein
MQATGVFTLLSILVSAYQSAYQHTVTPIFLPDCPKAVDHRLLSAEVLAGDLVSQEFGAATIGYRVLTDIQVVL